jgi:hypothetical protein
LGGVERLPNPTEIAVPAFVLLVLAEMLVARARDRSRYCPKDTLTSLTLGLGSTIAGVLTGGLFLAVALWVYQFRLFEIGYVWWAFLIAFVLDDLAYYWVHRVGHRVRWAWAAHVVHHSSQHYNLSTALRQTWTGFFGLTFLIKLPLFLIGFPPAMIAFVGGVNLVYQFWIHTEAIGRMPRWFEAVMNTPPPPRPPRHQRALSRPQLCRRVHRLGQALRHLRARADDERPRYGLVKDIGTFSSSGRRSTNGSASPATFGPRRGGTSWTISGARPAGAMTAAERRAKASGRSGGRGRWQGGNPLGTPGQAARLKRRPRHCCRGQGVRRRNMVWAAGRGVRRPSSSIIIGPLAMLVEVEALRLDVRRGAQPMVALSRKNSTAETRQTARA